MTPGRTVLIGWEVGEGFGHAQKILPLARALAADGHRPVLVFKQIIEIASLLTPEPFPVLRTPFMPVPPGKEKTPFRAKSYSDLLALFGFASVAELAPRLKAWDRLLDLVQPALVCCQNAPFLCLAALGRCPVVQYGSGFEAPPLDGPMFPRLFGGPRLVAGEEEVLAAVQAVLSERGQPVPATLPAAFAHAKSFLAVLPELDPYGVVRPHGHLGPIDPLPPPTPLPSESAVFAYLNAQSPATEPALQMLAGLGQPWQAYIRAAPPAQFATWRQQGWPVRDTPLPLAQMLAGFRVVVHHGGVGLSQQLAAAGRPQLILPNHLEQELNGYLLQQQKVAFSIAGKRIAGDGPGLLRQLLFDEPIARRAAELAHGIQDHGPWQALTHLLAHCRELLAGSA